MTKAELIEKLKDFPDDTPIFVPGFDEDGYDHLGTVAPITVYLRVNPGSHSGELGDCFVQDDPKYPHQITTFSNPTNGILLDF